MNNLSKQLYIYMCDEFPSIFMNSGARELLENVLEESERIKSIAERCEWLAKILPEVTLQEIRNVILR